MSLLHPRLPRAPAATAAITDPMRFAAAPAFAAGGSVLNAILSALVEKGLVPTPATGAALT